MAGPFPCTTTPSTCETNPNPVTGFSSEAQDSTTFIGIAWEGATPPLNKAFAVAPCEGIADSQLSQVDADRLARNAAIICANGCNGTFSNTSQTAFGHCSDGSLYSLTIPAGYYVAENQVLADRMAFTAATQALHGHSVCLGAIAPAVACRDEFYFGIILVISTDMPVSIVMTSGELPDGLTLRSESDRVVIEGTPHTLGSFTFTLQATSAAGVITGKSYTINITRIITAEGALTTGKINTAYSTTIMASPITGLTTVWSISSGSLPPGLSINPSTGVISGTPTTIGTYSFTVAATTEGSACTADYSIQIIAVDWGSMVWTNTLVSGGLGTASASFGGGIITCNGSSPGSPGAKVEGTGTVIYTGPLANCKAIVTIVSTSGKDCGFYINQDGVTKLSENPKALAPGVYEFPFTIAAGVNSVLEFGGLVNIADPAGLFIFTNNGGTDSFTFQLVNV